MPLLLAGDGIVALGIFALFCCFIMLRYGWVSTFGRLLEGAALGFDQVHVPFKVLGRGVTIGVPWASTILRGINHQALRLLGAGIQATEYAGHKLLHWTAYVIAQTGRVIGDLADDTYRALQQLWRDSIPALIAARLHPLASKVEWLIHRLQHLEAHPASIVQPVIRILDPRVKQLEQRVTQLAHALAATAGNVAAIPGRVTVPSLPGIRHGLDAVRDQVGRIVRTLTPAGIIGLVAAGIFALRLGWLKCGNVRRTAEHVCGMDGDLLEGLLAGTLLIFGTVSLVEFAREMESLMGEIQPAVTAFWRG